MDIARTIQRVVVPVLTMKGFGIISRDLEPVARWKDGSWFQRLRDGRDQTIVISRDKFGHVLGLNIGAQRRDGSYEYMRWHDLGLDPQSLKYEDQATLDRAVRQVLSFIEHAALPWLDAH